MKQLWAPWRMVYVGSPQPPVGCLLCEIEAGRSREQPHVVERGQLTFTVLNRFPYSSGHVMIVTRRHVGQLTELTPEEDSAVMAATRRAMRVIQTAMDPEGFNLGVNHGSAAGASVDHFHLHVVPRWYGDTNFMPVLADVKVLPEHLDSTAESLRSGYQRLQDGAGEAGS
ncbi:MAG TPA: HIT domain-containing protein [Candidatus Sulfotelmatobacter sp.]|nr:HIT domain-containing protein [Candidatus Sulfotelmatobacter sp.]